MEEKVKPFLALHYSSPLLKNIGKLVCPPYDVITKKEEDFLRRKSSYNFSHILLKGKNPSYQDLGKKFKEWLNKGVLVEEKEPSFYLSLQEFKMGTRLFRRLGFLGLLKLDEKAWVFPHERTHFSPKKDRYQVIKYTQANLSPIFVVYPKRRNEPVSLIFKSLKNKEPFIKFKDKDVSYKLWKVSKKEEIANIQKYFKNIPSLFIADGHHRFEVALSFFRRNRHRASLFKDLNYILAYFCPQDKNLLVLPTHRIIKKDIREDFLLKSLSSYFNCQRLDSLKRLGERLEESKMFSFGFYRSGKIFYLSLKNNSLLSRVLPKFVKEYKNLDVFLLHNWVFKDILNIDLEEDFLYSKDIKEATNLARKNRGCAFILRAPDINTVMRLALRGEVLPQKTTYFYPKFLSGLILRKLW